ncbi:MAG TPA: Nif3-like dinuclear metal center hexameric protein, partial [Planctomycetaceae bacterium]|nr:Nif3-like dinuclear metal center hexameric protein [Planctomycetaceae bacterium]
MPTTLPVCKPQKVALVIPLRQVIDFLREFAPPELAESWDNVGLLIGDPADAVSSVLTCLTLTPYVAEEAIARNV